MSLSGSSLCVWISPKTDSWSSPSDHQSDVYARCGVERHRKAHDISPERPVTLAARQAEPVVEWMSMEGLSDPDILSIGAVFVRGVEVSFAAG